MKKAFETPKIDVVKLKTADIITTSGNGIGEDKGEDDGEWA